MNACKLNYNLSLWKGAASLALTTKELLQKTRNCIVIFGHEKLQWKNNLTHTQIFNFIQASWVPLLLLLSTTKLSHVVSTALNCLTTWHQLKGLLRIYSKKISSLARTRHLRNFLWLSPRQPLCKATCPGVTALWSTPWRVERHGVGRKRENKDGNRDRNRKVRLTWAEPDQERKKG